MTDRGQGGSAATAPTSFIDHDGSVHEGDIETIFAAGIMFGCNVGRFSSERADPRADGFVPGPSFEFGPACSSQKKRLLGLLQEERGCDSLGRIHGDDTLARP